MTRDRDKQDDLFALFDSAREAERPGDDLVARVLADAARVQAEAAAPAPARHGVSGWLMGLGGWLGAGGLAAATAAGLLIGVYAPDSVDSALGGQLSYLGLVSQDALLPGLSDLLPGEGE